MRFQKLSKHRSVTRLLARRRIVALGAATSAALLLHVRAHAADRVLYWDTNSTTAGFGNATAVWGTATDWTTDSTGVATPGVLTTLATDDVNFNASGNQNTTITGAVAADHIQIFETTALGNLGYTESLSGGTSITLGGGASTPGLNVDGPGNFNISTPVILNAAGTQVTFDNQNYGLPVISGGITGNGNLTIESTDSHAGFNLTTGAINIVGSITSYTTNTSIGTISNYISAAIGSNVSGGLISQQGTLYLGGVGTYTGGTNISSGAAIQLQAANILPNGSTASVVLDSGLLNLNASSQIINGLTGAGVVDTTVSGTPTLTIGAGNTTSSFTGIIQNSAGSLTLAKIGSGTLTLSGNDTYKGGTLMNGGGGTIVAASGTALGASSTFTFGATHGEGFLGTLQFNAAPTNTYNISFGTNYSNSGTIQLNYANPNVTFGNLTLSQGITLNLTAGSSATGSPAMAFAATGNTFGATNNTTTSTVDPVGVSVSLGAMTPVTLNTSTPQTNTIDLDGTSTGNSIGVISNNTTNGNISAGAITKSNTSTWTMTGASTYTGPTLINGGTLILDHTNGTASLGNTAVNISGGATLLVKGSTTIANTAAAMNVLGGSTTATQGVLSLADGTINTLTLSGNLVMGTGTNGALLNLDLGTFNGSSDALSVTGSVTANGISTVNFNGSGVVQGNYTLIHTGVASFTSGNTGTATGFTVGKTPAAGFDVFSLSNPDANDLVLTVAGAPYPTTAYWTGAGSATGGDSANNWGYGSALSTPQSNWSNNSSGTSDALQVPGGGITNVIFTAANATSNSGVLTAQLDSNYSIASLTFDTSIATTPISSVTINTNGNTLTLGSGGLTVNSTDTSGTTITGTGTGILINAITESWENNSNTVGLNVSTGINGTAVGASSIYTLTINGTGTGGVILSGPIGDGSGGGKLALYLAQSGTIQLGGANNFSGGAYLAGGTLDLISSQAVQGSVLNMSGGSLTFDSVVSSNAFTLGGLAGSGNIALQNTAGAPIVLTVGSANTAASYGSSLTGTGSLVKVGTAVQTLTGSNTYTGYTNISAGTLQLASGGSIPSTTTLGFTGNGTLDLGNQPQSVASVTIAQGSTGTIANGTLGTGIITFLATNSSSSTLTGGTISNAAGITINALAAGGASVLTGVVESIGSKLNTSGGIIIEAFGNTSDNGAGNSAVFSLSNTSNSFTGGVNIASGLLNVSPGDGIFNNLTNTSTNTVTIASGAGLLATTSVAVNTSSFVLAGAGNHYIRPYGAATFTINGVISGTNAASGLYMVDGGTTVLAGSNSYTGATTVNDGAVIVTGNETAANGGWLIGTHSAYTATVSFSSSALVNVSSSALVTLGTVPGGSVTASANETLNVAGTVNNAGTLAIGRSGYLQINSGGVWNQTGPLQDQPVSGSGYSAYLYVNSGGTFNYNGSAQIGLTPSFDNGGYGQVYINGGLFNTSQGFADAAYNSSVASAYNSGGVALISLTAGGVLALTANVPALTTTNGSTFSITVGNGSGGIINTNGFNTSISSVIANSTGAGILIKTGAGTLGLTGASTYNGGSSVMNGTVLVGISNVGTTSGALGTAAVTLGSQATGGSVLTNGAFTVSNTIQAEPNPASGASSIGGNTDNNSTFSGQILLAGDLTISQVANTGSNALNITGGIGSNNTSVETVTFAGPGNINVGTKPIGNGTLGSVAVSVTGGNVTFTAANNYSGGTTITGGTLIAGATNTLSSASAINVSAGTLDVSGYADTIPSLTVGSAGAMNLGIGNLLTDTGTATFAGTLNLSGTPGSLPENLITYTSETGTFGPVNGLPTGDALLYTTNALELVSNGPGTLIWNNSGVGGGDGQTWDTVQTNWNNGTGTAVAYSDTSNTSTGDIVTFNDNNNGNYSVVLNTTVHPTSVTFANNNSGYTLSGSGGISGPGSLTLTGTNTVTVSTSNNYSGGTFVSAGTLVLASAGAFPANTSLNISTGAQVTIANHSTNATYVPTISSLANSGTIDITNNAMIVHNGDFGAITAEVAAAYNGGTWTGTNSSEGVITSSMAAADTSHLTAVGVATNLTTFEGTSVSPTDVLLKYTYYGDANLDGQVDGADYSRIDYAVLNNQTSGSTLLSGWSNGDFNYDGVINGSDYTLIDNSYNTQGANIAGEVAAATAQIAGSSTVSAVPEPTTLGLLSIGTIGLLSRRTRRRRDEMLSRSGR
jgi:autotransporter-associated beta strand protein